MSCSHQHSFLREPEVHMERGRLNGWIRRGATLYISEAQESTEQVSQETFLGLVLADPSDLAKTGTHATR